MLKIRKTKWIAGFLSLALTGGAAALTTACGNEDKAIVQDKEDREEKEDQEDTRESDIKPEESEADKPEEAGGGQESAEMPFGNDGQDYSALAARIDEAAVTYLEAMKAGDIETILSMTDPDSVIYKKLSGIKDYEIGREFIHAICGGVIYECREDSSTERYVERVMEGEQAWNSFFLDIYIGAPHTIVLSHCLTVPGVVFQDGELIPDGYEVTSDEEALQMVRSAAELVPLESTSIMVDLQDDGTFYFEITGPFMCMNESAFGSGENFLTEYLTEHIQNEVIVGKSDGLFEGYQDEWTQIYSLLKQKDFDGLLALANGDPDKYIKKSLSSKASYATPEELTEAQRAFFDSYVEQIDIYVSEITYAKLQKCSFTVIISAPAISLYDQDMEWYSKNGIKECTIEYKLGSDRSDNLIKVMSSLLSPIEDGIEYAEKKY